MEGFPMSTSSAERAARRIWQLSVDAIAGRTDAIYREEVIAAIIREELARDGAEWRGPAPISMQSSDAIASGEPKGEGKSK